MVRYAKYEIRKLKKGYNLYTKAPEGSSWHVHARDKYELRGLVKVSRAGFRGRGVKLRKGKVVR